MKKRMASLLLALIMLLTVFSTGVTATGTTEDSNVITIDFNMAEELSAQDWWNDLVMGSKGAANMAEAEAAQYDALREYLAANKNWTISEEWSQFKNMYQAKEIVFNTDTTRAWGMRYYAGYVGVDTHDKMYIELNVPAEQAGWYTFSTDIFRESVYSAQASHGFQGGGGYGKVLVNGEIALEEVRFLGGDTVETITGNVVKLKEGVNLIAISNTKDVNGQASNAIRSLCFNSITFTKTENPCVHENTSSATVPSLDKTHKINVTCVDCGDVVSTETVDCTDETSDMLCDVCGNDLRDSIIIDFVGTAEELAQQDWWQDLIMGSTGAADMTGDELAQYEAMRTWLAENKNWNISEEWSQFINMYQAKEMVFNTDPDKDWGLRYYAGYVGVPSHDKMYIELEVTAEQAGWYSFNANVFKESVYSAQASHRFQGGGGYGQFWVNGEVVLEEMSFLGSDTVETVTGNEVKLVEGTNMITIANTKDVNGGTSNGIRTICLNNIVMYKTADLCSHEGISVDYTDNGDKTHTTTVTCSDCSEVISTETVACADEDKDTLCDDCGAAIVEITKIDVAGANMTLGNDLKINFMVKKSDMQDGFVAMVSQAGGEPVELELWDYNSTYYAATYSVAAKEMTDVLSVEIYNADGYLVSNPFTRTVKQYAMTLLNNASQKASLKSVIVDMLNYGTEAQKYFGHNELALANAEVTAEQQETYATKEVECVNNQQGGTNFVGANLSLEDSILLNVFFKGITNGDLTGVTATVSFTDYLGNEVTANAEIGTQGSSMVKVVVNQIVLADAKRPVTVTVYKDGAELGSGVESVESYIARNLSNADTGALNMAIMKFSASAYAHLGGTN